MTNPRLKAYEILEDIEKKGAFSNLALKNNLGDLKPVDKAFVTKIVYGVLQNKILIDYYLKAFTNGKRIKPKVRNVLRVSVYQILFMDKVPDNAAVNEGVDLSKKVGLSALSGFVNGVLRTISREKLSLPAINSKTQTEFLSIKYSHPEKLVETFIKEFGIVETEKILHSNNTSPDLIFRVNTLKTTTENIINEIENAEIIENDAIKIVKVQNLDRIENIQNGEIYVQDLASQKAIEVLNPLENETLIDVCSAPGGKSFLAAIKMKNKGGILSFDIFEHKTDLIDKGAEKLGIDIIKTAISDATVFNEELSEIADKVICDVPCSGFGIIRRKPEIRYKEDVSSLPKIQLDILKNASKYLKKGGTLLYTTCTIFKDENSNVVNAFLSKNEDFYLEEFELFGEKQAMITLLPHKYNTDGFFIAKIRRK